MSIRSLGLLTRYAAVVAIVGMAAFSVVSANDDDDMISCCGNTSTPTVERCRYTDRDMACTYDSTCASDVGYTICCQLACLKKVVIDE